MRIPGLLIIVPAILLSACQITPPASPASAADACAIPMEVLPTPQPDEPGGAGLGEEQPFQTRLRALLSPPANPSGFAEPKKSSLLFMSGGSQKGSFGAGFLKGWSRRPGGLPKFDMVTGVSAGSILTTAAFIGDGDGAAETFAQVNRESDVLRAFARKNAKGDFSTSSYLSIARHGAAADLTPMRDMLITYLRGRRAGHSLSRIEEVRAEALTGRDLYVGAVDLDSGQFVAFNLGGYLRTHEALTDKVVGCYATAVLASSSVPMAALPVFIDGRLYVDGGARNGMFGMQLINQLYELAASGGADPALAPNLYLLVNGTQAMEPDCDAYRKQKLAPPGPSVVQDEFCRKTVGDPRVTPPKRPTWSLATVGLRSVDVLINQVYRANAEATFQAYQLAFHTQNGFHFARMKPDAPDFRFGDRSCGSSAGYLPKDGQPTWFQLDEQATHPLEFYPRYMKCLIAYGEHRAAQEGW
jgi:hypothetical protein